MKGEMRMRVLIVSSNENTANDMKAFLLTEDILHITVCKHATKARRLALESSFDMILINYPLIDESDYALPLDFAEKSDASILIMSPTNHYDTIVERMEHVGIYVLAKPIQRQHLMQSLHFMVITQKRLQKMRSKSMNLSNKIQEIKLIDRAKCLLIEKEHLTELQAHRFLEKKAMDLQINRVQLAKKIIKKYDITERR